LFTFIAETVRCVMLTNIIVFTTLLFWFCNQIGANFVFPKKICNIM